MAASDTALLRGLGDSLLGGIAQMVSFGILYGAFLLLFCYSIVVFTSSNRKRASLTSLAATIISFLIATLDFSMRIYSLVIVLLVCFLSSSPLSLEEKVSLANEKLVLPNIIFEWTTTSVMLVNDFVVFWRVWIIIPEERFRATVGPLILLFFTIVTSVISLVLVSNPFGINEIYTGIFALNRIIFTASIVFSLLTNASTIALFTYRIWRFRSFLLEFGTLNGENDRARSYRRLRNIFALLVESGAVYCVFQLGYLAVGFVPLPKLTHIGARLYTALFFSLSAIYPTLVAVLVSTQRSIADRLEHDPGFNYAAATPGHLSFAPVTTSSLERGQVTATFRSLSPQDNPLSIEKVHTRSAPY